MTNFIGGFCITVFLLQFFVTPFVIKDYEERKNWFAIENALFLIAAAICFK